ncbi:hypothetical protein NDU88_003450 [Pleurodeles waltl]|uniref:Uncharacterized protein n=1 Tax=Pleurodeles waltl TaxID=8319 RepID=A0AAV7UF73_PLEWA|nr:hypothetical protein NDU88_003450 [Pleurodeles waltl]
MEQPTKIIEELAKELQVAPNQEKVKIMLAKMEERILKQEEETKAGKAHTFNQEKLDYEYGRIYTFARKYNTLRAKEKINVGVRLDATPNNTDVGKTKKKNGEQEGGAIGSGEGWWGGVLEAGTEFQYLD